MPAQSRRSRTRNRSILLGHRTDRRSRLAGGASVVQLDRDRFQRVMESYYGGPMIEALLVRFETSYLVRSGAGLELQAARRGNLAEAISRSIANPFIFRVIGRSSG